MNAICGFTDLIQNPNISSEKLKQFINYIHKSSNQLLNVVENTVTIAHIETKQLILKNDLCYPNEILIELYDSFEVFKHKIDKGNIELILNYDSKNNIKLLTDSIRLKQIINICLDNSFKFIYSGRIIFEYNYDKKNIQFFIKDTGIGIPKDKQEIIFKSFAQADESIKQMFGGIGLGLSIAIGLIKLLGGKLIINSDINIGTEIIFSLPIYN